MRQWTAADVLVDCDRLSFLVIKEIEFRKERNAVDLLSPRTHELDAAARHDVGLEAVGAKIGQQLERALVDTLRVRALELGLLRSGHHSVTAF
jgi:hypothetical protein